MPAAKIPGRSALEPLQAGLQELLNGLTSGCRMNFRITGHRRFLQIVRNTNRSSQSRARLGALTMDHHTAWESTHNFRFLEVHLKADLLTKLESQVQLMRFHQESFRYRRPDRQQLDPPWCPTHSVYHSRYGLELILRPPREPSRHRLPYRQSPTLGAD